MNIYHQIAKNPPLGKTLEVNVANGTHKAVSHSLRELIGDQRIAGKGASALHSSQDIAGTQLANLVVLENAATCMDNLHSSGFGSTHHFILGNQLDRLYSPSTGGGTPLVPGFLVQNILAADRIKYFRTFNDYGRPDAERQEAAKKALIADCVIGFLNSANDGDLKAYTSALGRLATTYTSEPSEAMLWEAMTASVTWMTQGASQSPTTIASQPGKPAVTSKGNVGKPGPTRP